MKKIAFLPALLFVCHTLFSQTQSSNVRYVDPTIGAVGLILEPTRPTVHLPNSMVRVFPSRKDQIDDQIDYFPLTISSHRQPSLFSIMPYSGAVDKSSWRKSFLWGAETTTPYYYSVRLPENGDSIEFSPSARAGFFRFHFKGAGPHYLRVGVLNKQGNINVQGKRIITGTENVLGLPAFFFCVLEAHVLKVGV
jgi:putative alpha-1,2-mannosidase